MRETDEPYRRKREPLKQHLGADQDIKLAGRGQSANRVCPRSGWSGVPVQPANPGTRKQAPGFLLHPFGAEPNRLKTRSETEGTGFRDREGYAARVASQAASSFIEAERHTTVRALLCAAAVPTEKGGREAFAVEEQHDPGSSLEGGTDAGEHGFRQDRSKGEPAEIHDPDGRRDDTVAIDAQRLAASSNRLH